MTLITVVSVGGQSKNDWQWFMKELEEWKHRTENISLPRSSAVTEKPGWYIEGDGSSRKGFCYDMFFKEKRCLSVRKLRQRNLNW